jgi:hypothetical protein
MSQHPPGEEDSLDAQVRAYREKQARRRLQFFLEHGEWINSDPMHAELLEGDHEAAVEVSRRHALARGCSPELVERMYGPSIHKKKDVGEAEK